MLVTVLSETFARTVLSIIIIITDSSTFYGPLLLMSHSCNYLYYELELVCSREGTGIIRYNPRLEKGAYSTFSPHQDYGTCLDHQYYLSL